MRVLFDTNVLIAAFLTEGLCRKLLVRANRKQFLFYTSQYILEELRKNLLGKFSFTKDEVNEAILLITEVAEAVNNKEIEVKGICRDRKDNAILASALVAKADYLVTGDADLIFLKRYKGVKILSPRGFEGLMARDG